MANTFTWETVPHGTKLAPRTRQSSIFINSAVRMPIPVQRLAPMPHYCSGMLDSETR
jgi:hypothetical protein